MIAGHDGNTRKRVVGVEAIGLTAVDEGGPPGITNLTYDENGRFRGMRSKGIAAGIAAEQLNFTGERNFGGVMTCKQRWHGRQHDRPLRIKLRILDAGELGLHIWKNL